jgi:hypothetical protein
MIASMIGPGSSVDSPATTRAPEKIPITTH